MSLQHFQAFQQRKPYQAEMPVSQRFRRVLSHNLMHEYHFLSEQLKQNIRSCSKKEENFSLKQTELHFFTSLEQIQQKEAVYFLTVHFHLLLRDAALL